MIPETEPTKQALAAVSALSTFWYEEPPNQETLTKSAHKIDAATGLPKLLESHGRLLAALERIMEYAHDGAAIRDIDPQEQPQFIAAREAIRLAKEAV